MEIVSRHVLYESFLQILALKLKLKQVTLRISLKFAQALREFFALYIYVRINISKIWK